MSLVGWGSDKLKDIRMGNTGLKIFFFLLNTVFTLYMVLVILRFLLQWVKADFYNPLCQFLITATNPLVRPLRRVIPGWWGLDWSCLVLLLILQVVLLAIKLGIIGFPLEWGVITVAIVDLVKLFLNVLFYAVIAGALVSWIPSASSSPVGEILHQLTFPILRPIRRWLPLVGGIDLSPLVALLIIQVLTMAVNGIASSI